MRGAKQIKTIRARALRASWTDAELKLWHRLRSRSLSGFKFVRQDPIGPYVADFCCREMKLIVEVDGGQHAGNQADAVRGQWLSSRGYRILRFWNNDVLRNTDGVLETILSALLAEAPPHPAPSLTLGRRPLPASGER